MCTANIKTEFFFYRYNNIDIGSKKVILVIHYKYSFIDTYKNIHVGLDSYWPKFNIKKDLDQVHNILI